MIVYQKYVSDSIVPFENTLNGTTSISFISIFSFQNKFDPV